MTQSSSTTAHLDKIFYDQLTWVEIRAAVAAQKVVLLPVGSVEQHGPHLPLDVDNLLPRGVCVRAAESAPSELLILPTVSYGYNEHALDFPGTVHVSHETFIRYMLDVVLSVAHAGFERILIVDGHGSNEHLCEFVARRAMLQSDALVASLMWTGLAAEAFERIRESGTGGAAHACELETSAYLHLEPSRVQMDKAVDHLGGAAGDEGSAYLSVDLTRGWGPARLVNWTSSATPNGVSGCPTLATEEKGRVVIEAAAANLLDLSRELRSLDKGRRVDHRRESADDLRP